MTNTGSPRGRSGGRAGGSGYDFQDLYVGWQLAQLLLGAHRADPIIEVLWERKGVEWERGRGAAHVHVGDVVLVSASGRRTHVEVKEAAPVGEWTVKRLAQAGVLYRFWREWTAHSELDRSRVLLRIASASRLDRLGYAVDVARQARTPAELTGDDASEEVVADLQALAAAIDADVADPIFGDFLRSIQVEQLPSSAQLEGWIQMALVVAGRAAPDLATRLVRLVSRSKHADSGAGSAYTRTSLVEALLDDGVARESLVGLGVVRAAEDPTRSNWDRYRSTLIDRLRRLRVYGLATDSVVIADLPSLFVPMQLRRLRPDSHSERHASADSRGPDFLEESDADENGVSAEPEEVGVRPSRPGAVSLNEVIPSERRFAIIGPPGSGKTTLLKWLAVVAAMPGKEGRQQREDAGLSTRPCIPIYVRFRQFAERVEVRGLHGVEGRVGLVADFLAAQFEGGITGEVVTRSEALVMAQAILDSDSSLLLFDGLDEVPDASLRERLFDAVADLIDTYKEPMVVVASRPYAFPADRARLNLPIFEPLPMDASEQRLFARNWYRSVGSVGGDLPNEGDAARMAADLARTAEGLGGLAETPLLLSILAAVHFNRRGLPIERASLYGQATLAMLGHWDRDPSGRDLADGGIPVDWSDRLQLDPVATRHVVSYLARACQLDDETELTRDRAVAALAEGLADIPGANGNDNESRAQLLLRLLIDRSGLLQELSPNVIGFIHLSFQEYLAARSFVDLDPPDLEALARLGEDDRHAEVVRMAVAVLASDPPGEQPDAARALLMQIGATNAVLVASCLAEVPTLTIEPDVALDVARSLWADGDGRRGRRHVHPRRLTRLMWAVLPFTASADEALLDCLARDTDDFRRGPDSEMGIALMASRPAAPCGPELEWFLRRLSSAPAARRHVDVRPLAELLLVESGRRGPAQCIASLVSLLGSWRSDYFMWSLPRSQDPGRRAVTFVRSLLRDPETSQATKNALRAALSEERAADELLVTSLLIDSGESLSSELGRVLVEVGLADPDPRHIAEQSRRIVSLLADPSKRPRMASALRAGLRSSDLDVRRSSSQLLHLAGLDTTAGDIGEVVDDDDDEDEDEKVARLATLMSAGPASVAAIEQLTDDVWDENADVAWVAARALCAAMRTDVPGLPQAIVEIGFGKEARHATARRLLNEMRRDDPRLELVVRGALLAGTRNMSDRVATASALALLETGGHSPERLDKLMRTALRDPGQLDDLLPHLSQALGQRSQRDATVRLFGEYLGSKPRPKAVRDIASVLAEWRCLSTPNLPRSLAAFGLADTAAHQDVIPILHQMLDDPQLVTPTRTALSEVMKASDSRAAWGAATCLWQFGSRSDSELPAALARAGLTQPGRHEQARTWLEELLVHARTGRRARVALERVASSAMSGRNKNFDLAWLIARCLADVGMVPHSGPIVDAIVLAGFHDRRRHAEVRSLVITLIAPRDPLASELEQRLLAALDDESEDVAWGAAETLLEIGHFDPATLARDASDDEDSETTHFLHVLVRESVSHEAAATFLSSLPPHLAPDDVAVPLIESLLSSSDPKVGYRAARWIAGFRDLPEKSIAVDPIVRGGLASDEDRDEASQTLDRLMADPERRARVLDSLNRAMWGPTADEAWGAAVYIAARLQEPNPGVPRALVFAGLGRGYREREAEERLELLLEDPRQRVSTLDALAAHVRGEDPGERSWIATLLLRHGSEPTSAVLGELEASVRYSPVPVLALFALLGTGDAVSAAARNTGHAALADLLGASQAS